MEQSGWLEKHSGGKIGNTFGNAFGKWDKRFFTLDPETGILSYYRSAQDKSPAGQLDCNGGGLEQEALILSITTDERTLTLRAGDQQDAVLWYCALAPFCDGGAARARTQSEQSSGRGRPHASSAVVGRPHCASMAPSMDSQRAALGLASTKGRVEGSNPFGSGGASNPFGSPSVAPTPPPPAPGGGSSNKPFGGGGGGGGTGCGSSGGGSSAGAPVPPSYGKGAFAASKYVADLRTGEYENDEELKNIEEEIRGHEIEMDEATKRMLRMANETVDTGAATLNQMYDQGKQLDRIQGDQARVQHNLDTSKKILVGMTSFMGWRAWGQDKEGRYSKAGPRGSESATANTGNDAAMAMGTAQGKAALARGQAGTYGGVGPGGGASGASGEPPDAMDQISSMMQTMHSQALAMNHELKSREKQLDTLVDTAVNQNHEIKRHIKDTASVGGRKAKEIARGGAPAEGSSDDTVKVLGEVITGERSLGSASLKVAGVSSRMAAWKAMQ